MEWCSVYARCDRITSYNVCYTKLLRVNEWVKKAVILYFPINKMETIEVGPFEFHDKIALKKNFASQEVRVRNNFV